MPGWLERLAAGVLPGEVSLAALVFVRLSGVIQPILKRFEPTLRGTSIISKVSFHSTEEHIQLHSKADSLQPSCSIAGPDIPSQ
jgi:hypothetical protein